MFPARHLETEDLDDIADPDTLDVRVEPLSSGLLKRSSGDEDAFKGFSRILAEALELLDDMVDVVQEGEEEPILRTPDQSPHRLGEPDVEDGIIKSLPGCVVLEDLKPIPRFQPIEQTLHDRRLFDVQADGDPSGIRSAVIKVDVGDVCARSGDVGEEVEESPGLMGEVYRELEKPKRGERLLEVADRMEIFL